MERLRANLYWPVMWFLGFAVFGVVLIEAPIGIALLFLALLPMLIHVFATYSFSPGWLRKGLEGANAIVNRQGRLLPRAMLMIAVAGVVLAVADAPKRYADYANTLELDELEIFVRQATQLLVLTGLLVSSVLALWLRPAAHYKSWNEARGTAEAFRRELFERIIDAKVTEKTGAVPRLSLILAYFTRYQIELQTAYHQTRGREHQWNAGLAYWTEIIVFLGLCFWSMLVLGAMLSGGTEQGALSGAWWPSGVWLGLASHLQGIETSTSDFTAFGIALLLALIAGGLRLHSTLNASIRNAPRYAQMQENFKTFKDDVNSVRAEAVRGGPEGEASVRRFMARVHSAMSVELNDWVNIAELEAGRLKPAAQPSAAAPVPPPDTQSQGPIPATA
jgi:hypothetical protein